MLELFVFIVVVIFFAGLVFVAKDTINHADLKA